eukprot:TRINITY_DN38938_c0_g1_i2.p1 TRINITY_DN38938_c0_g1~~TRINITY_DN38938_c0_g1_i2.p1  ORF type:complete len:253 (+),score=44.49 TRINITY_DN38938_c0_g1_i2:29-787(+)
MSAAAVTTQFLPPRFAVLWCNEVCKVPGERKPWQEWWSELPHNLPETSTANTFHWEGRRCDYSLIHMNGKPTACLLVAPSTPVRFQANYHAHWQYNSQNYCPGCVVQFYIGMNGSFNVGLVRSGIHDHAGSVDVQFPSPDTPGVYSILHRLSLMYNFQDGAFSTDYAPPNERDYAVAKVIVLPPEFNRKILRWLPRELKDVLLTLLIMGSKDSKKEPRYPQADWHKLPCDVIMIIFMFIVYAEMGTTGIQPR